MSGEITPLAAIIPEPETPRNSGAQSPQPIGPSQDDQLSPGLGGRSPPEHASAHDVQLRLAYDLQREGDRTLYQIFHEARFKGIRRDLDQAISGSAQTYSAESPIFQNFYKTTRLREILAADGTFEAAPYNAALTKNFQAELIRLKDSNLDVAGALEAEPRFENLLTYKSENAFHVALTLTYPGITDLARQTKLSELFGEQPGILADDATPAAKATFQKRLMHVLPLVSISALLEVDMEPFVDQLKSQAKIDAIASRPDTPTPGEIDSLFQGYRLKIESNPKPHTLEEILDPKSEDVPRLSSDLLRFYQFKLDSDADEMGRKAIQEAAATSISAYQFLSQPPDPTGALDAHLLNNPLLTALRRTPNLIPAPARAALEKTLLSDVIGEFGQVSVPKVRDIVIGAIADRALRSFDPDFLSVLSPELAAPIAKLTFHPQDEATQNYLEAEKLGTFRTDGDQSEFVRRADIAGSIYPPLERAEDAARYNGLRGEANPWRAPVVVDSSPKGAVAGALGAEGTYPGSNKHQAPAAAKTLVSASAPKIAATDIPYTYDFNDNGTVGETDITHRTPLTLGERERFDYVAWRLSLASGAQFTKVSGVLPSRPDESGKPVPRGIVMLGGDMAVLDQKTGLLTQGVTYNGMERAVHQRVDIIFAAPFSIEQVPRADTELPVMFHEAQHGLGNDHPFRLSSEFMPGSTDQWNEHSLRYGTLGSNQITTDDITTAYTRGKFVWLSPTPADVQLNREAFGSHPGNLSDAARNVIVLKQGDIDSIVKSRDPFTAWVGDKESFAQTIVTDPGKATAFDFRMVDGKPVQLSPDTRLDLSSNIHDLKFVDAGKPAEQMTRVATMEADVKQAALSSGTILGTSGADVLQVENSGFLDGRAGNDTFVGGRSGPTRYRGGLGHKLFILRDQPGSMVQPDEISAFKKGDLIVAPEDAKKVDVIRSSTLSSMVADPGGWTVKFYDAHRHEVKSVNVHSAETPLEVKDIAVETTHGKALNGAKPLDKKTAVQASVLALSAP